MAVSSAPTASNSALQSVANTISVLNVTAGTFEYAGSKIASGVSKYYTEGVSLFNKNNLRVRVPLLIGNIFPKVGTVKQIGKFANRLGMYTGIAGVGLTAVDGYTNGWQKHHTADISITSGFIVAGAIFSGPYVVIAGCVYLVTDIGLQISTGKSLTENLFD